MYLKGAVYLQLISLQVSDAEIRCIFQDSVLKMNLKFTVTLERVVFSFVEKKRKTLNPNIFDISKIIINSNVDAFHSEYNVINTLHFQTSRIQFVVCPGLS